MRLIDADALKANVPNTNLDIFENCRNCSTLMDWEVKELIDKMPTIDAVEVKHGEWIIDDEFIDCSVCRCEKWSRVPFESLVKRFRYCPKCGAKMDGKEQNDE